MCVSPTTTPLLLTTHGHMPPSIHPHNDNANTSLLVQLNNTRYSGHVGDADNDDDAVGVDSNIEAFVQFAVAERVQ